jgi:hypothetical protein
VTATAETPAAHQPAACAACGAGVEPHQEYCLECGSRIAYRRGPLGVLARAVEARVGRTPGDWFWISLLLLGIAAGGATAAIALTDDATGGGETIVATSTPPTAAPPATSAPPPPTATASLPTTPPKPATKPALLTAWPAQSGYTVVLASIPARGAGRVEARDKARAALDAGLPQVGILVSDNFASLHPGYYVVFSGVYESLEDALTGAKRAAGRFPAAYARQIAR